MVRRFQRYKILLICFSFQTILPPSHFTHLVSLRVNRFRVLNVLKKTDTCRVSEICQVPYSIVLSRPSSPSFPNVR